MLRDTFGHDDAARAIEYAVGRALESGFGTADIATSESATVSTSEMGDAVALRISNGP